MSRILVTGGLGRKGSEKVEELVKAGHEVLVLDDLSKASISVPDGVQFIKGSVTDRELVSALVSDVDEVWHYAWTNYGDDFFRWDVNETGKFNVRQYCRQYDKGWGLI